MEVAVSIKSIESHSAINSIIERALFRVVFEALLETEAEGADALTEIRESIRVQTPLGRMRVRAPKRSNGEAFSSPLICGKARKLSVAVGRILELAFVKEAELPALLERIYSEILSERQVSGFGERLTESLKIFQESALAEKWEALYFGTTRLCASSHATQNLDVDYCIGMSDSGETRVIGLWDSGGDSHLSWISNREELEVRGLKTTRQIWSDSPAATEAFLQLVVSEQIAEEPIHEDVSAEPPANDDFCDTAKAFSAADTIAEEAEETLALPKEDLLTPPAPPAYQIPTAARAPRHFQAFFSCAAVATVLLVGGFYRAVSAGPASAAQAPVVATVTTSVPAVEVQLVSELRDSKLSGESLIPLIRLASMCESREVVKQLIQLGDHQDAFVRVAVAKALGSPFEATLAERKSQLMRMLNDSDFLVRGFAARSLASIGTPDAREALLSRVASEDDGVVRSLLKELTE